jgi:FKBP-type peptidyl-prolyl cis-trans isomerase
MKSFLLFSAFVWLMLSACRNGDVKEDTIDWSPKKSTEFNKEMAAEEELQISLYLEQHKELTMEKSGTGLRHYIYQESDGQQAVEGYTAQVELQVTLLDGKVCYQTKKDEYEEFVIDRSDIETGLQEGIKMMKVGERAKFIVPSHIAHGLLGDMDKIPPLSPIVIDVHLIGLIP